MVRKLVLAFTGLGVASAVAIYLFTIPLLRRLPKPSRVSVDGITTIDDVVNGSSCDLAGLKDMDGSGELPGAAAELA